MLATVAFDLGLFALVVFGLGLPACARGERAPLERLVLAVAAALVAVYLFSFVLYAAHAGPRWHWLLPLAAALGLAARAPATWAFVRLPEIRAALGYWLLVTAWGLGLLALIFSYSGGGWMGDWQEHYERARFFLLHGPQDFRFIGVYALTARPPLANLVTGSFLALTDDRFAQFQVFSTLLNSLVFFPALLFVRRWGAGRAAPALLALGLMLNPLFAQNLTFGWTKLATAFFVLAGLYFLSGEDDRAAPASRAGWPGLPLLCAGLLTHYSAGPWMAAFVPLWFGFAWARRGLGPLIRSAAPALLAGGALLATWFGWAAVHYGVQGTVGTNSSVLTLSRYGLWENFEGWLVKLTCTIVPHPFHWVNPEMTAQTNRLAWVRDYCFNLYQLNLPLAFGSAGLLVLVAGALRAPGAWFTRDRRFWLAGVPLVVVISVAVQAGPPDLFGITHVCLQPLVILGLAGVAARLHRGVAGLLPVVVILYGVDFAAGIALHFAGQAYVLGWQPGVGLTEYALTLNAVALINLVNKINLHQGFLRDLLPLTPPQVAGFAAALPVLALALAGRAVRAARRAAPGTAPVLPAQKTSPRTP